MERYRRKLTGRYRQIKDEYPLIRSMRIKQASNISAPGADDILSDTDRAGDPQK